MRSSKKKEKMLTMGARLLEVRRHFYTVLLLFTVAPWKIRIKTFQYIKSRKNLRNVRRLICRDTRRDSDRQNFSYASARYSELKWSIRVIRALYGDAMLVPLWRAPRPVTNKNIRHFTEFCCESVNSTAEKLITIKMKLFLIQELFR